MTLSDGWPPFYSERKSSADVHVGQLYVAFVATALGFAFILVLPGVRGIERSYFLLRWSLSLLIGALIVASGQGISWQVADIRSTFRYKVTDENLTTFDLGLRIGLAQFNITLRGSDDNSLNMNEQFFYTTADEMIDKALLKGMPFPILNVAEHFSSTRFHSLWPWGRRYWLAGHYGSYLLWTALACWIITNVIFHMTFVHGSILMFLTGVLLLSANISFASVNSAGKLVITMGHDDPPKQLRVEYGWCFWTSLSVGLVCVVLGVTAYVIQIVNKSCLEKFFMVHGDEEMCHFPSPKPSVAEFPAEKTPAFVQISLDDEVKPSQRKLKRVLTGDESRVIEGDRVDIAQHMVTTTKTQHFLDTEQTRM